MRAEQEGDTTLQEAERVVVMSGMEREAAKKDSEFWVDGSRLLAFCERDVETGRKGWGGAGVVGGSGGRFAL